MTMDRFDEHIILRYLQKKASEEEVTLLEQWIAERKENRESFNRLADLYHASEATDPAKKEEAKRKWLERYSGRNQNRGLREVWKIAAVIVLSAGLTWLGMHYLQNEKVDKNALARIHTPAGSVTQVTLPDGTRVWLNAESSLTYHPAVFGRRSREVSLTGEAYFDVVKNKKVKFVVNTSRVRIRVYGTRFNVKAYPEDATIETTLEEGRIALTKTGKKRGEKERGIILKPQERAVFVKNEGRLLLSDVLPDQAGSGEGKDEVLTVKSGNILVADKVDTEVYTSWKEGRLIIRGEPLDHLAKKLERRYDVHFIFRDNASKSIRFTGTLEDETLEQVLYAIGLTAPVKYTIDHKNVYLEKSEQHP